MNIPRRPWLAAIAVSCFLFGASPARAQMTMVESGFVCILLNGDFAKQIEVGVGPDTCVYYGSNEGLKRRCNPNGPDTICDPALTFPAGIAFSTGGAFLNRMYVADFGQGDVFRSTGCAAGTMFADMFAPGSIAFPPAGSAYGDFLYACEAFDGPIYRINSTGTKVEWLEIETVYLRFGPGGAWGTGLYATDMSTPNGAAIVKISSAGAVTPFVDEFVFTEGFDWGFDGDMFATDAATGEIWRIKAERHDDPVRDPARRGRRGLPAGRAGALRGEQPGRPVADHPRRPRRRRRRGGAPVARGVAQPRGGRVLAALRDGRGGAGRGFGVGRVGPPGAHARQELARRRDARPGLGRPERRRHARRRGRLLRARAKRRRHAQGPGHDRPLNSSYECFSFIAWLNAAEPRRGTDSDVHAGPRAWRARVTICPTW